MPSFSLFRVLISLLILASACSSTPKTETPISATRVTARSNKAATIQTAEEKSMQVSDQIHFDLDTSAWKKVSDAEGIQTYEKIEANDQVVAIRGEALIPVNLLKIATVLNSRELQKEWVDSLESSHEVGRITDLNRIEYNQVKVPFPFENRDFVYQAKVQVVKSPPTMLIDMKSVTDAREPEKKGIVRGQILYSFYYLKQVPGVSATKVVIEMALDPKGAIPKWLVTLSQKRWPLNTLRNLKKNRSA